MITLYKIGKKAGHIQQWTIEVEGSRFRTIEGLVGGKLTTNAWTECEGKNIGKSNETSPERQAELEALSKAQKKRDRGYSDTLEAMEVYKEPTLAKVYEDYQKEVTFPAYLSPKLDGVRCTISKDGMLTRQKKPILSCPHIMKELEPLFEKTLDLVFDGELYNHKLFDDFDQIISLSRQLKPTQEDFDAAEKLIEFHVFDLQIKEEFFFRRVWIDAIAAMTKYTKSVQQVPVNSHNEIVAKTEQHLKDGYEGSIVRWGKNDEYIFNRTKHMLKVKVFIDEEFEVVDITEGKGKRKGTVGRWIVRLKDGTTNKVGPTGSDEKNAAIYAERHKYIGKMATIEFQGYTRKGKLRFPTFKAIREDY